ncbi:MAG TPA: hypothetical protein VK541_09085 [Pedobacter sp.]|uniref:hypothetical protein n=1 Tax=Pedobacter sp. TaxID=1411316 RepID=UPI002C211D51|nr:hypothetical protein [Pedobacter sp.]HMI02622.1 hypothetical protein [Pedobacter sp.]
MKTTIYTILAFMLLSSSTCKKEQESPDFKKQLVGKWQYTGKSGGYAGKSQKADPAVVTVLEFKKDNAFLRSENDQVKLQGTYSLTRLKSIYSGKEENAVQFDATADPQNKGSIITLRNDSLTIADNVYDGFTSDYIRIK